MVSHWVNRLAALSVMAALVAACAPPPEPPPEPTVAQVNVTATDDANPDPNGRPSPAVVHLYALQPGAPFEIGDYEALTGGELGELSETMTRIARMVVVPGKTTKKIFELPDGASDVGITVAYRQIDTSKWRASQSVKQNEVNLLKATVGANEVTLQ